MEWADAKILQLQAELDHEENERIAMSAEDLSVLEQNHKIV